MALTNNYDHIKDMLRHEMERQQSSMIGQSVMPSIVDQYRSAYGYPSDGAHTHRVSGGAGSHSHSMSRPTPADEYWKNKKRKLLCMRLDIPEDEVMPFEFLDFMDGTECVFVMVAKTSADKPIVIEDDRGLFPSDTLITQLRMMIG